MSAKTKRTRHSGESRNLIRRRRIRRLRCRAKRFRLSPEWCILIKRLKVPPFRRKPESLSPQDGGAAEIGAS
ncbi:MAG: hypothetical protein ACR2QC_10320 [Gammaproteobacteria bacterium]